MSIRQPLNPQYSVLSPLLDTCVRCGLCLPQCPTYLLTQNERSSPRGRIALMNAVTTGDLDVADSGYLDELDFCLGCRNCETACPAGVEYGAALEIARAGAAPYLNESPRRRVARRVGLRLVEGDLRALRAVARGLRLFQRTGARSVARFTGLLDLLGVERLDRLSPDVASEMLLPDGQVWRPDGPPRLRVGLFTGCVMSVAFAEVHLATIRTLVANGCEVVAVAGQGCCGALHAHTGDVKTARRLARRNVAAFERQSLDAIVVNAAGCGAALKEYGGWLHGHPRATTFVTTVCDYSELLLELDPRPPKPVPLTVTYQDACHLAHAQGVRRQPRELLARVPALELREMAESDLCCGSAGTYNLTRPETAEALLERKLDHALATGAGTIVTTNPGCMLQLRSGLSERGSAVQVRHLAEIVAAAYD
ncbi:MAG: (Fe-S)-binding protein [Chloroflexi bacterium]|nr:(Fe-S)-binding protein [Chloroflexota bacterium]